MVCLLDHQSHIIRGNFRNEVFLESKRSARLHPLFLQSPTWIHLDVRVIQTVSTQILIFIHFFLLVACLAGRTPLWPAVFDIPSTANNSICGRRIDYILGTDIVRLSIHLGPSESFWNSSQWPSRFVHRLWQEIPFYYILLILLHLPNDNFDSIIYYNVVTTFIRSKNISVITRFPSAAPTLSATRQPPALLYPSPSLPTTMQRPAINRDITAGVFHAKRITSLATNYGYPMASPRHATWPQASLLETTVLRLPAFWQLCGQSQESLFSLNMSLPVYLHCQSRWSSQPL